MLSLSVFSASLPVPFVPFCSASGYLAFCSSVPFFLLPPPQWPPQCFGSSFRLPRFPPSLPPGFPCFRSGFRYLAFCSFPFILPGFAPTAAPPVLPFFSASLRPLLFRAFRLLSGFSRPLQPASDYSASCPFFSPLPDLPWQRFSRCATVPFVPVAFPFRSACFHASLPVLVLSFLHFLSPFAVSPHSGYLSASAFRSLFRPRPPGFRFRFRLLGLSVLNFSVPHRTCIYYHHNHKLSTSILYIFQLFPCVLRP